MTRSISDCLKSAVLFVMRLFVTINLITWYHVAFFEANTLKLTTLPAKRVVVTDAILTRTRDTKQHDQPARRKSQDMEL